MIEIALKKSLENASGTMLLDIDIKICNNQFVSIYGPSGSGKTTLLRMIAGLTDPDTGKILVNRVPWYSSASTINIPPQKRNIGYVFQEYALFPNMTVMENLRFPLPKGEDNSAIASLIDVMELGLLRDRYPRHLSGGQQQRVALARALVRKPKILLLDEPLSALDITIRKRLQDYLAEAHRQYGLTTIMVSHDLGEIIKLSEVVYCLENGKIRSQGDPKIILSTTQPVGQLKLRGEVVSISQKNEKEIVGVLIGSNIVQSVLEEDINQIRIGDFVSVYLKGNAVRVGRDN